MGTVVATVDNTYGAVNILVTTLIVSDLFTRTVVNGMGTATSGQIYTLSGTAADFDVTSPVATIQPTGLASDRIGYVDSGTPNFDEYLDVSLNIIPASGTWRMGLVGRLTDANNHYILYLQVTPAGVMTLVFAKRVAGVLTNPVISVLLTTTYVVNTVYRLRFRGAGTSIQGKIFLASGVEPTAWNISTTDTSLTTGNNIGIIARNDTAVTTHIGTFDNLSDSDFADYVYLTRVTPDGVATPVRNSPSALSAGSTLFWDDEAPLNTLISYVASNQAGTLNLTSNSVTITGWGGEISWVKDPITPANDIPLGFAIHQMQLCNTGTTGVGLVDFGDVSRTDADGEFPLINARYPAVVTQRRKSERLDLTLISLTHSDIIRLNNILDSGRVLLIQSPVAYGQGLTTYGNVYVHVLDVTMSRPTLDDKRHQQRVWTLPTVAVLQPADTGDMQTGSNGVGVGHATYDAMKASGLTYTALTATGKTYTQLAQGQGY